MRKIITIVPVVFLLIISWTTYPAETSPAREAITKYFEAVRVYDTEVMADMMHPQALKQFRDSMDGALNGPKSDLARTEILPIITVSSIEEYQSLSNRETYKRLNDVIVKTQPDLLALMKNSEFKIVTENIEGDIAYFTYALQINMDGQSFSKDVVQKLKLSDGKWMLLLAADAEATIAGIAARYNN